MVYLEIVALLDTHALNGLLMVNYVIVLDDRIFENRYWFWGIKLITLAS